MDASMGNKARSSTRSLLFDAVFQSESFRSLSPVGF